MVRELFAWLGDDRYSSRSLYLQIYARPSAYPIKENYYGGGRTFNGPPNTGGGVIQLELSWLMTAQNFPFLSTLIHELGHGFGLTHADCHGYDMDTNGSMMSANTCQNQGVPLGSDWGMPKRHPAWRRREAIRTKPMNDLGANGAPQA